MSDGDMTGIESDISYRAVEMAYASHASYAGPENKWAFLAADFSRRPFLLTCVSDSTFSPIISVIINMGKGERLDDVVKVHSEKSESLHAVARI
jgi:hypothetical protein